MAAFGTAFGTVIGFVGATMCIGSDDVTIDWED